MRIIYALAITALCLTACGETDAPNPKSAQGLSSQKQKTELTQMQHGAKIYTRCRACHTLEENEPHKVGPNLWNIYGSTTASKEGFAYSKAMKAANIVWDETSLDAYLRKPSDYMPGNRMTFIGLKKQTDRDAVQAYLKQKTTP